MTFIFFVFWLPNVFRGNTDDNGVAIVITVVSVRNCSSAVNVITVAGVSCVG